MNDTRRKILRQAAALLTQAAELIEGARDAEQEAYDNLPEAFQAGERGETMQTAIGALDDALGELETIESSLTDAIGGA